jgi:hypothetical protein
MPLCPFQFFHYPNAVAKAGERTIANTGGSLNIIEVAARQMGLNINRLSLILCLTQPLIQLDAPIPVSSIGSVNGVESVTLAPTLATVWKGELASEWNFRVAMGLQKACSLIILIGFVSWGRWNCKAWIRLQNHW